MVETVVSLTWKKAMTALQEIDLPLFFFLLFTSSSSSFPSGGDNSGCEIVMDVSIFETMNLYGLSFDWGVFSRSVGGRYVS